MDVLVHVVHGGALSHLARPYRLGWEVEEQDHPERQHFGVLVVHGFLVGENANEDVGVDSPAENLQMIILLKPLKKHYY